MCCKTVLQKFFKYTSHFPSFFMVLHAFVAVFSRALLLAARGFCKGIRRPYRGS